MAESEASASFPDEEYFNDGNPSTLRRSLEDCLDNVKNSGSFATSGILAEATSPGLSVHNVGSIACPLQEGQAKAIIGTCHQAPFGQGSRTVIDESVRKTWQLNPDQFVLRNPKWPSVMQKVTERVARELGCVGPASVDAQLYKMLLYEKGAMFKPHKDTEKAPGMFGTLVICLPSEYEGGAVVASHRGVSQVFEAACAFDYSYIAWYADVTHEVKAVTSGYRLVLTYNLIDLSQGLQRSAAMLSREKRMLKGIISSWTRSVEGPASKAPHFLAYKLDHKYTDANLRFRSLKGLDKVKADYFREVCAGANAGFYLASMERKVMGSCEEYHSRYRTQKMHALDDVVLDSIELKRMIDLNGSVLAREISIDGTDIVQRDPFARDPDKEDFAGYTGNEGASATQFYHDTVAVLVPYSSLARFLSRHIQQGIVDINPWCLRLSKKVHENPNDENRRQELYHLAVLITQTPPGSQTSQSIQAQKRVYYPPRKAYFPAPKFQWPMIASIIIEDQALFEMAIESINSSSPSPLVFERIGKGMFLFDLPTTHIRINTFISRISSFHGQYRAFVSIVKGFEASMNAKGQSDDASILQIEAWAKQTFMHTFETADKLDREDGLDLVELTLDQADRKPLSEYVDEIPEHCALILARYLQIAQSRRNCTAFSVAFITHLLGGTDPKQYFLVDDFFDVLLDFFNGFFPTFSVECRSVAKRGRSESGGLPSTVQCLMNADDVATLLVMLDGRDLEVEAGKLITKLEAEAGIVDVVAFEGFFLPLLEALIAKVDWSSERVTRYGNLFRTTLWMFARRFVQIEPPAGNWTNSPLGCGCFNCRKLDDFLVNASQQSIGFPVCSGQRAHLHQMLDGTRISHVTERRGVETLVVTKPAPASMVKYEEWQTRFAKAEERIKKLNQEDLQELLDVDYEYLTELRATRRGREPLPSRVSPQDFRS